jgi:hypothetical protein
LHDSVASIASYISVKYRPSGEYKYRLVACKPRWLQSSAALVRCDELHDPRGVYSASGRRVGFGAEPRRQAFTKLGKERIQDAGAILDAAYGLGSVFVTGTIPASGPEADKTVAAWSAYIVQRIKQLLVDNFDGLEFIWVWERHESGQLHFHGAAAGNGPSNAKAFGESWHRIWCQAIEGVAIQCGYDLGNYSVDKSLVANRGTVRTDAQFVRKSIGSYLAKYLSKTAGTVGGADAYCPSSWWGMSNSLRQKIKDATTLSVSSVLPYVVARRMFESLVYQVREYAEKIFRWRNKYAPLDRTCVAWLAASG